MLMASQFLANVLERLSELILAPAKHPDMIWIVLPLLVVIIMMTLYFARYNEEELGWNTALGNSLVLVFVSIDLFRTIYNKTNPATIYNYSHNIWATLLVLFLFSIGFLLMYANFSHTPPKKVAYFISSSLMTNLLAYVMITIIYSSITVNWITILAGLIYFIILALLFTAIGFISRRWWSKIEHIKDLENVEDVRKGKKHLEEERKHIKDEEKRLSLAVKSTKEKVEDKKKELERIKRAAGKKRKNHKKHKKHKKHSKNKRHKKK
jgi:hypothetical protein